MSYPTTCGYVQVVDVTSGSPVAGGTRQVPGWVISNGLWEAQPPMKSISAPTISLARCVRDSGCVLGALTERVHPLGESVQHFGESPDGQGFPSRDLGVGRSAEAPLEPSRALGRPNSQRSFSSQRREEPVSKHPARHRLRLTPNCDSEGSPRRSAARHRTRHRRREGPWREPDEAITAAEPQGRLSISIRELLVRHSQHDADRLCGMNCRSG